MKRFTLFSLVTLLFPIALLAMEDREADAKISAASQIHADVLREWGCLSCELPGSVKAILDQHTAELQDFLRQCNMRPEATQGLNVMQPKWLPGYYVKYGIHRLSNAQRLKSVARRYNFNLIDVPNKCSYHVAGRPRTLSSKNYLVIAEKIVDGGQELNIEQARQLVLCTRRAQFIDTHTGNYVIAPNGKVIIIDTGDLPSRYVRTRDGKLIHFTTGYVPYDMGIRDGDLSEIMYCKEGEKPEDALQREASYIIQHRHETLKAKKQKDPDQRVRRNDRQHNMHEAPERTNMRSAAYAVYGILGLGMLAKYFWQ